MSNKLKCFMFEWNWKYSQISPNNCHDFSSTRYVQLGFNSISVSYLETGHEQDKRWLGKNICFFGLISPYDLSRFLAGTLKSVKIELWATAFQLERVVGYWVIRLWLMNSRFLINPMEAHINFWPWGPFMSFYPDFILILSR